MNQQILFFKENGYLIIKDFYSKEEIEAILREAKGVFLRQFIQNNYIRTSDLEDIQEKDFNTLLYKLFDENLNCLSNCGKQVQHLISLHKLSLDKRIFDLLIKVGLKTPIISTRPVLYFNHPKLAKQKVFYKVDAHQDWRSMQGSLNSVVVWVPLVNINKDLGALEILPKSHKYGLRTDHVENGFGMVMLSEVEKENLISVEVNSGDILLFSSFLIHQSGENVLDRPRWSCHFRYNDLDDETFIKRNFAHPYIYKPIDELLTPNFPTVADLLKIYE